MASKLQFVAVFVICLLFGRIDGSALESFVYQDAELDDFLFTDYLLFDVSVSSLVDCAGRCSGDGGCVAFTHIIGTAGSESCRGHSAEMTSSSAMTSTTLARTFNVVGGK